MDARTHRELRQRSRYVAFTPKQARWTFRLRLWLIAWVGWLVLRLWMGTCRLTVVGLEHALPPAEGPAPVLGAWHRNILYMWHYVPRWPCAILSSRSDDGQLASELIRRAGSFPVCGSSSRGGVDALRELAEYVEAGVPCMVLVDGPRGPARECKLGVVRLARRTGGALVPTAVAAERFWRFGNWDGTLLPRPFTRVLIQVGEPLAVPRDLKVAESRDVLAEFNARLNALQDEADASFAAARASRGA